MATTYPWHIRVLGSNGHVEARGEGEIAMHRRGRDPEVRVLDPVDAVRAGNPEPVR
jgi:hypothetical protein